MALESARQSLHVVACWVLTQCALCSTANTVILTGDIHSHWVGGSQQFSTWSTVCLPRKLSCAANRQRQFCSGMLWNSVLYSRFQSLVF